jgi:hypothetical protein
MLDRENGVILECIFAVEYLLAEDKMRCLITMLAICMASSPCFADKEISSQAVLFSNSSGFYYVKSVPNSREDQYSGTTRVYRTKSEKDELLCEYNWYASRLWLFFDGNDLILVRLGPWHRTGTDPKKELEVGFYKNGKVIKEYTALEVALDNKNFIQSQSHYAITSRVKGLVIGKEANYFEIHTFDGRDLRFDLSDGSILKTPDKLDAGNDK